MLFRSISLGILALLLFSCSSKKKNRVLPMDRLITDSFLVSRMDSVYTHPLEMKGKFRKEQKNLTDSFSYYKLELFIGFCQFLEGQQDSTLAIYQKVLDFCKRTPETEALEAICWNHRAMILQMENNRDSALRCLHHAYDVLYRSYDRRELTSVCINIGDQYNLNGNLPQAAAYYRKALFVADSLNTPKEYFPIYLGLAHTYSNLHNFGLANHYFQLAESFIDKVISQEKVIFYNLKGNFLYEQKKYAESLECFKKGYVIANTFEHDYFRLSIEINLGELYTLLNQTDSAHYYLDKAYNVLTQTPYADQEQLFYLNSLYVDLALKENNLTAANEYLSRPYTTGRATSTYLHNKRLMNYYEQKKDFKKAFYYKEVVEKYDDSLRNARNVGNITEIDYRYSQDTTLLKRDVIIANNKVQLSKQEGIIILSIALLVISILLAFIIILHIRRKNERKYSKQIAMVSELRMENIRNRISPHYVFNVLNAIMPTFKQYSELAHPLQLLIEVLRGNLLVSDKIAVELEEEIELVKKYTSLRKETNPNTATVIWEIDENISMHTLIPTMIIQIPVENSLKYAFESMENGNNQVAISISQNTDGLFIHIKDNGDGYHPGEHKESKRGTGTGLKVLFRTIELLNSKNQPQASFDIQNLESNTPEQHGTLVTIFIPFNYQFKF